MQMTFATAKGFEVHGRATRKAEFLARMEALVPWAEFCALIEPHYRPKAGHGRPPRGAISAHGHPKRAFPVKAIHAFRHDVAPINAD